MGSDGLSDIRHDLANRVAAIEWRAGPARIADEVDRIRAIAHRHRLLPAVTVAHLLGSALARGERGALIHGWLALLREAVVSERQDQGACDAFAAACTVRFAA
ncbi:MAG: hypothetical protein PGN23_01480 [Sphingomonas adhaesiva]|uniref:hypothetical protein n=1 Tax=Sphingomonas adhaesiva TaxID=28212 RepID=UPI002FF9CFA0